MAGRATGQSTCPRSYQPPQTKNPQAGYGDRKRQWSGHPGSDCEEALSMQGSFWIPRGWVLCFPEVRVPCFWLSPHDPVPALIQGPQQELSPSPCQ